MSLRELIERLIALENAEHDPSDLIVDALEEYLNQ